MSQLACDTSLLLDALHCQNNASRPPIWLMRQAGRYMPSYQALRRKYSLLEMFRNAELITQVTLKPLQQLGTDAAIIYSDILIILDMLGIGWDVEAGIGPVIFQPLSSPEDVSRLTIRPAEEALPFLRQGLQEVCKQTSVPVIGFCGAPFTIASYLIEGRPSRELTKTKQWMLREPESFHQLLELLAEAAIQVLNLQISAGASAVQIFDSWANSLAHVQFREFSLRYLQKIIRGLQDPTIPVIKFCRGSSVFAEEICSLQSETSRLAISLDWNSDIGKMRSVVPSSIALQGNLDPSILYADKRTIQRESERILRCMQNDKGFVFNLGHGVLPDTPFDHVKFLVDYVKQWTL
jgi:uroporphyrinogen decarboxylase